MTKLVLGIETSCDDTSISIIQKKNSTTEILSHHSYSQELILEKWGGVVPELAARNHLLKLTPLLKLCFDEAGLTPAEIDLIGVTTHPGLLGPLLTGLNAAKTISLKFKIPIVSVNHLFAHLEAVHITENIEYPYLGLLVSGGHSIYFWVTSVENFEVIGSTIDDAAGEAFDKGGKQLGLGYPAGKTIDNLAKFGVETTYEFPIGLVGSGDAKLSFSGVKTALRYFSEKNIDVMNTKPSQFETREESSQDFYNLIASYQWSIVRALTKKLKAASKIISEKYHVKSFPIVVGGGVACNSRLREEIKEKFSDSYFVKPEYCTDNGAMIANYALRNYENAITYPECLSLDARGRFIDKAKVKNG